MNAKNENNVLKEFVHTLSDQDVVLLASRLVQNLQGDLSAALNFISSFDEMDQLFKSKTNSDDFYESLDQLKLVCEKEASKRGLETVV